MTRDEMIAEIEYVCRMIQAGDRAFDALDGVVGCNPDSPFWSAVFGMQGAIVKQTAKLIGDEGNWLEWFIFDNDGGRKGLEAKAANWKKRRRIKTAAQLAGLIEASA